MCAEFTHKLYFFAAKVQNLFELCKFFGALLHIFEVVFRESQYSWEMQRIEKIKNFHLSVFFTVYKSKNEGDKSLHSAVKASKVTIAADSPNTSPSWPDITP